MPAKDVVYSNIRQKILSGELPSDTPLVETQLAKEHGVSRTPVREALQRLVSEQLVRIVPGMGSFVGGFSWTDARDIFVIRTLLEAFAGQLTAGNIHENDIEKLSCLLRRQRDAATNSDADAYEELDDAFHSLLIKASGNGQLLQVIGLLNDRTKLAQLRHNMFIKEKNLEHSLKEHEAILDAILARKPQEVARLVWDHGRRFYGESVDAKMPKEIFLTHE